MFLIRTRIGPSTIHGNGVFACETVEEGTVIWRFEPLFDHEISEPDLANMPAAFREYIDMYAYRASDLGGRLILSGDHAKFLNHSDNPNTSEIPLASLARRKINADDEITCDYGAFCAGWNGFDDYSVTLPEQGGGKRLPHQSLYTRIQRSENGIGVFAIRDIPQGARLFGDDVSETVAVPRHEVEAIADDEMRRMYLDFCPLVEDHYIAPVDFNEITMSWYLNHSSDPNVVMLEDMTFVVSKFVPKGIELRADYTTYSKHAARYVKDWR